MKAAAAAYDEYIRTGVVRSRATIDGQATLTEFITRLAFEVAAWDSYSFGAILDDSTLERVAVYAPELATVPLLRDIFGNPFRPVVFDFLWRSDTAVSLAKGMYESRDFSAMPILADALQDVGCDNDDILNHCRDEKQVHVCGCWVVDLVLWKA